MSIPFLRFRWVDCSTFICNLSYKPIIMVSSICSGLYTPIRKGNGEGPSNFPLGILSLCLLKVILRVVISYSILIGKWLGRELLRFVSRSWVVGSRSRVVGRRSSIGGRTVSRGSSEENSGR